MAESSERIALITGSTSGIGLGIAKVLAGKGYSIIINGFGQQEEIHSILAECRQLGARLAERHGADLSDPKQIEHLFEFVVDKCGHGPDVLVNNAGIQHVSPIESFSPDIWDKVLAVNLSAAFHTTRLAVKGMKERGWGRIVNISSVHGLVGSANKAAYVASKHGIVGLTKVVALETAGTGVTCNAICPGWVLTPLVVPQVEAIADSKGLSFDEAKETLLGDKQPSKDFALPEEIGSFVAYLTSDEARQITGSTLTIDGGWTAQ